MDELSPEAEAKDMELVATRGEDEQGSGRSFRRPWAETKPSGLCDDEFRPEGRVPFGTARKEPKGGLGAQSRLNSGQRASLVRRACPLRTPGLRGSKTGASLY